MGIDEKNMYTKFHPNQTMGKESKIGRTQIWEEEDLFVSPKLFKKFKFFGEKNWNCGKPRKFSMDIDDKNTYTKFHPNRTMEKG